MSEKSFKGQGERGWERERERERDDKIERIEKGKHSDVNDDN